MAHRAPASQQGDGARRCLFVSYLLSREYKAFTGLRLLSWIKTLFALYSIKDKNITSPDMFGIICVVRANIMRRGFFFKYSIIILIILFISKNGVFKTTWKVYFNYRLGCLISTNFPFHVLFNGV